jgi:hypothetical protein
MRLINLCFTKPETKEFHNGIRTDEDIRQYQKKYRDSKRKKREHVFQVTTSIFQSPSAPST